MGGRGSGGRRTGSGRKKLSDLERAVGGNAGKRGAVVLQHPSATAVAPIETFEPPADWVATPAQVTALAADLAFLKQAPGPGEPNPQIAALETRLEQLQAQADALAVWHELAPHAFTARTLTPATAATFLMLCRAVVKERALSASSYKSGGPDHRGMMARVATLSKDFVVAPFGKPLYAAEPAAPANPLDRFTKTRA
jgi:hypothetical protein